MDSEGGHRPQKLEKGNLRWVERRKKGGYLIRDFLSTDFLAKSFPRRLAYGKSIDSSQIRKCSREQEQAMPTGDTWNP